ncbi:MAG: hypothetical protein JXB33_08675 [Clostridia bacterium]|nr:hypothetical protein [Clostridia bacterium]
MFSFKPGYDDTMKRFEAFLEFEIHDRPPVNITLEKPGAPPFKTKAFPEWKDRWLDLEYRTHEQVHRMENTLFLGDSLPIAWPNMGPEIYSAWCGCGYNYGETTTWSDPCIHDWEKDYHKGRLDREHPLLKKTIEYTDMLIEESKGRFIVGFTDFHPGGDHIAALRDPQELCFDMIENVDYVKRKLAESYPEYFEVYDLFYDKLSAAGMPSTTWLPLPYKGKLYVPSNDFSCMISKATFDDIFLQGLIEECRFYDKSIYHLDGPGALQHLDSLLDIKELNAIQWVCGSGNEGFARWLPVYRKIQKGKKGSEIFLDVADLDLLFENLRPEGIWIGGISGVDSVETAEYVLKRVGQWK